MDRVRELLQVILDGPDGERWCEWGDAAEVWIALEEAEEKLRTLAGDSATPPIPAAISEFMADFGQAQRGWVLRTSRVGLVEVSCLEWALDILDETLLWVGEGDSQRVVCSLIQRSREG